eukprot:CAMPEP_0181228492 /NCGR_PEP_ID=MMETSP1096-20121128/33376_1 /TAXON_ID=156174 ORGANISM="Chrysochromulina ericina, Strain CCMP281" /NCGR_SAMPLE_ID=MMETSP1096 /ASSEMBLY_ACC=CAM_ASM_000453 /LENGTH=49 /DNA_ID=CAMNT_0023322019 /DNA_START=179 /DNA_END=328 /DNA_ORIENTATION=+
MTHEYTHSPFPTNTANTEMPDYAAITQVATMEDTQAGWAVRSREDHPPT